MFTKGKRASIGDAIEGYEKLDKGSIAAGSGILIENVLHGVSEDNGDFVYVTGTYQGLKVFVSIPAASLDDFIKIDDADVEQIRRENLKLYIDSHASKKGRTYYTAYIDD